jgi:hypothetical protein
MIFIAVVTTSVELRTAYKSQPAHLPIRSSVEYIEFLEACLPVQELLSLGYLGVGLPGLSGQFFWQQNIKTH